MKLIVYLLIIQWHPPINALDEDLNVIISNIDSDYLHYDYEVEIKDLEPSRTTLSSTVEDGDGMESLRTSGPSSILEHDETEIWMGHQNVLISLTVGVFTLFYVFLFPGTLKRISNLLIPLRMNLQSMFLPPVVEPENLETSPCILLEQLVTLKECETYEKDHASLLASNVHLHDLFQLKVRWMTYFADECGSIEMGEGLSRDISTFLTDHYPKDTHACHFRHQVQAELQNRKIHLSYTRLNDAIVREDYLAFRAALEEHGSAELFQGTEELSLEVIETRLGTKHTLMQACAAFQTKDDSSQTTDEAQAIVDRATDENWSHLDCIQTLVHQLECQLPFQELSLRTSQTNVHEAEEENHSLLRTPTKQLLHREAQQPQQQLVVESPSRTQLFTELQDLGLDKQEALKLAVTTHADRENLLLKCRMDSELVLYQERLQLERDEAKRMFRLKLQQDALEAKRQHQAQIQVSQNRRDAAKLRQRLEQVQAEQAFQQELVQAEWTREAEARVVEAKAQRLEAQRRQMLWWLSWWTRSQALVLGLILMWHGPVSGLRAVEHSIQSFCASSSSSSSSYFFFPSPTNWLKSVPCHMVVGMERLFLWSVGLSVFLLSSRVGWKVLAIGCGTLWLMVVEDKRVWIRWSLWSFPIPLGHAVITVVVNHSKSSLGWKMMLWSVLSLVLTLVCGNQMIGHHDLFRSSPLNFYRYHNSY